MFILCPHCQFLVAIDPASGLPPARCPRCGQGLRAEAPTTTEPESDASAPSAAEASVLERAVDADRLGEMLVQAQTEGESPVEVVEPADLLRIDTDPPWDEARGPEQAGKDTPADASEPATPSVQPVAHAPPASGELPAGDPETRSPSDATVSEPTPVTAPPRRAHAPSFARIATDGMPVARRWSTLATLAALSLLLVLQVLLADRARLAADARWRPTLDALCGALRCTLPAWHEPEAFTLVARDVRPLRAGVLHVTATFRNDARWRQAWPALHLALQDVDGRTIGARVFAPKEYLGGAQTQNGLAPGQSASVAFDVGEPPGTVVAFTFDFR